MCYGVLDYDATAKRHGIDFHQYFASELVALEPMVADGLAEFAEPGLRVLPRAGCCCGTSRWRSTPTCRACRRLGSGFRRRSEAAVTGSCARSGSLPDERKADTLVRKTTGPSAGVRRLSDRPRKRGQSHGARSRQRARAARVVPATAVLEAGPVSPETHLPYPSSESTAFVKRQRLSIAAGAAGTLHFGQNRGQDSAGAGIYVRRATYRVCAGSRSGAVVPAFDPVLFRTSVSAFSARPEQDGIGRRGPSPADGDLPRSAGEHDVTRAGPARPRCASRP